MARTIRGILWFYQKTLSPDKGPLGAAYGTFRCRFYPSCSVYAEAALRQYGLLRGGVLSLKRLARCHPLSRGGYDPLS